ncbi:hypothetical protein 13VO501A_gene0026 [Vibrio phage 13VO501A]|nr:hypothetical protein 13VO501A_gene0026 [Vibrio phage 13VO501A]
MIESSDFHLIAVTLTTLTVVAIVAIGACCALIHHYRQLSKLSNRCITLSERAAFSGLSFVCFARGLQQARSRYYRGEVKEAHLILDMLEDQINELYKNNGTTCHGDGASTIPCSTSCK